MGRVPETREGHLFPKPPATPVQEIFAISRRALGEMADQDLEQRLFTVLLDRLQQMAPEERQIIQDSIQAGEANCW